MRGKLSDTSVPEICRQLSDDGVTGALEVTGATGVARVFLRDGSVYWAMSPAPRAQLGSRLVNAGFVSQEQLDHTLEEQQSASGDRPKLGALLVEKGLVGRDVIRVFVQEQILDALFDLVRWDAGEWVFHPGDAVDERLPIDVPVRQLLVEVSRRQNEWDQIERTLTTLDEIPDHVVGGNATTAALEQDEFTMLASIDGVRSVRELANDLGYSEFEAARIVYGLTLLGIVDVTAPEEAEGEPEATDAAGPAETAEGVPDEPDATEQPIDEAPAELDEPSSALNAAVDEILDLETGERDAVPAGTEATEDEIDIGEALESALFGDEPEEQLEPAPGPAARPQDADAPSPPDADQDEDDLQVTVHFSLDQGGDGRSAHAREGVSDLPDAEPVPTEPGTTGVSEPAASDDLDLLDFGGGPSAEESGTPPVEAGTTAAGTPSPADEDEPEPWVFSADDFEEAAGRAEEWAAGPEAPVDETVTSAPEWASPETDPEDWASPAADPGAVIGEGAFDMPGDEPEPAPPPAPVDRAGPAEAPESTDEPSTAELTDDLDALVAELDAGDDAPAAPAGEPAEEPREPAAEPSSAAADLDDYAPQRPSTPEPATERGGRGDVSEFLRELTRLNVEDESPADESKPEPAEPPARRSTPKDDDKDDKDKKKKGLFGWGR